MHLLTPHNEFLEIGKQKNMICYTNNLPTEVAVVFYTVDTPLLDMFGASKHVQMARMHL